METEEKTVKKAPTEWTILLKETYPLVKEALDGKKMPNGTGLKVAGYLKKQGIKTPSLEDVKKAIEYLEANPHYKAAGSVSGRPPKKISVSEELEIKTPMFTPLIVKGVEYCLDLDENEVFTLDGGLALGTVRRS